MLKFVPQFYMIWDVFSCVTITKFALLFMQQTIIQMAKPILRESCIIADDMVDIVSAFIYVE